MALSNADLKALIKILIKEDFLDLVQDDFPKVYENFTEGQTKAYKVRQLVEYITKHEEVEKLLEGIKNKNLKGYETFFLKQQQEEINKTKGILSSLKSSSTLVSPSYILENLVDIDYVYLIIELKEKLAQVSEQAHFEYIIVNSILAIPQGSNQYLHKLINNIFNNKTSYTKFEIENQFIQLITETNQLIHDFNPDIKAEIIIEWLVPYSLLSSNFELWEQEGIKICFCHSSIHVRLADRIDIKYRNNRKKWKKRWDNLQNGIKSKSYILAQEQQQMSIEEIESKFSLEAEDTLIMGVNFSTDLQKLESKIYRNLLISGIPLALWSRCKNTDVTHIGDLDNLINPDNVESFNLQILSDLIQSRRRSITQNQEDDLGCHLCFLLENPYNYPLTKQF